MKVGTPYVLGLDLGTNSVGWALVELRGNKPAAVVDCGVRVFEAGLDGDIESGKAEPRNAARRIARQVRRQTDRRRRRKRKVFHLLQGVGLLPSGRVEEVIPRLDHEFHEKFLSQIKDPNQQRISSHLLPYLLRSRALTVRLEPFELGRAFYHLAQRRGFLSNRKTDRKSSEDGVVIKGISELENAIKEAGAQTLGAFFASLDPEEARIRGRWTARSMYETEFEKIWEAQQQYLPGILTESFRNALHRSIFFQRPLKSTKDLIGNCNFEPRKRRAPWALLVAQEFRILQKIRDTRVLDQETGEIRSLSREEAHSLSVALDGVESLTLSKARKVLGLKNCTFNWEESGEKNFIGNRTAARIREVIGDRWEEFTQVQREALVDDLLSIQRHDTMIRRARAHWGCNRAEAESMAEIELEPGYCNLSRKALKKLVPLLREGEDYATAAKRLYPDSKVIPSRKEFLPRVVEQLPQLRNPVVSRVLTELRKVVNGIIREYGCPATVRIELARDIKSSRKEKRRRIEKNRTNTKLRETARRKILEEMGIKEPTRHDILKVQLAEECSWQCPYTGRQISMGTLVGPHSQFDVEHIIPYSRCFDNSFINKTLCFAEENRNRKNNRSPSEAYAGEPEKYNEILARVGRFQGPARMAKLRRFQAKTEDEVEGFRSSQLNDTRYASRLAIEYLGTLFGGAVDENHCRRVHATRGPISAVLRNAWNLNSILSKNGKKTREDHRHHAVDAIVIALTTPGVIQEISALAAGKIPGERLSFDRLPESWDGFVGEVREVIGRINVSHRPSRRVSGALHEETIYSPPRMHRDGHEYLHRRKAVHEIGKAVEQIVDPVVRQAVKDKIAELGGDPKKLQGNGNLPVLRTGDGRQIPIRRVRIRVPKVAIPIGKNTKLRYVLPGSNHHLEIFSSKDARGRERWIGRMVTLLEAADRLRKRLPVVDREHPDGHRFVFSLSRDDIVEIDPKADRGGLWRVQKMTTRATGSIEIVMQRISDARQVSKTKSKGRTWSPNTLCADGARKLNITPTGRLMRNRE